MTYQNKQIFSLTIVALLLTNSVIFTKAELKNQLKSIADNHTTYVKDFICEDIEQLGEFLENAFNDLFSELSLDKKQKLKDITKKHAKNLDKVAHEIHKATAQHKKKLHDIAKHLSVDSASDIQHAVEQHKKDLENFAAKVKHLKAVQQKELATFAKTLKPDQAKRLSTTAIQHEKDLEDAAKKIETTAQQHEQNVKNFVTDLTTKKTSKK